MICHETKLNQTKQTDFQVFLSNIHSLDSIIYSQVFQAITSFQLNNNNNKKTMEHEGDGDTSYNWCAWNDLQRFGKGSGRLKIREHEGDHLVYCIIMISQNNEKSSGDTVTQTQVENHHNTGVKNPLKSKLLIIIMIKRKISTSTLLGN